MRHGIPVAGNFLQQELAVGTGAVEAMVVDVQCIMSSLPSVASCFHTKLITTSRKGKIPGALHIEFDEHRALEISKRIVREAVENYPNRKGEVQIPEASETPFIAGFGHETINRMLGGRFRASYRPLNDNIINGRIRGVAGVVGCNNPKTALDNAHLEVVRGLIANDILVVQTGCSAIACAKGGLLASDTALEHAGPGLREVCEAVGIPPVLHCGSCVDNSRILVACSAMVREGGLGEEICDLPVAAAAPEWTSEKAISIGEYAVASGIFTVFGVGFPTTASDEVCQLMFEGYEALHGATWAVEPDPQKMVERIREHIEKKRTALGINVEHERKLFDMEDRRKLEV
jgi:carbon-monoxide dehydrogenase catalytic subunit